jgi:hypothetical protein
LIIGGQRCGTTSFYESLTQHPCVLRAAGKELHFFDYLWQRGEAWYRSQFPLHIQRVLAERMNGAPAVTGEATPYYLSHPHVPRRASEIVPHARLIVLLRDPLMRAHSHYEWMKRQGFETIPFDQAVRSESSRLEHEIVRMENDPEYHSPIYRNFSYLARGRYAEQLKKWLDYFPRDHLLVLESEEYFKRPENAFATTFAYLELPNAHRPVAVQRPVQQQYDSRLDERTREFLTEYFRGPNAELTKLLGRTFSWSG